jgi:DNA-binding transcriptional regulator YhcF (GntR family)
MSFTEKKQTQIKQYILEKINENGLNIAKRTAKSFDVSLNTVYRYIHELEQSGIIEKNEKGYTLVEKCEKVVLSRTNGELLEEDIIYEKYINKYMQHFSDNVQRIWQYSFTEMMNNAIDHSESEIVTLLIYTNHLTTTIIIIDKGVGIFRKIKEYYNYNSLDDAVNELFKGKLTTDSKNHSGEGIFFTSRVLDRFCAVSDGKIFTHNKYSDAIRNLEDTSTLKDWKDRPGTTIYMELSNFSNKVLKEVFDMFSDTDGGFTKTHIPIKNIYETYPVSRSQAKRLCHRFEKFQEVELDFDGIPEIGQGFAHEIFVVFQNDHKEVRLIPVNASDDVTKMINHVTRIEK